MASPTANDNTKNFDTMHHTKLLAPVNACNKRPFSGDASDTPPSKFQAIKSENMFDDESSNFTPVVPVACFKSEPDDGAHVYEPLSSFSHQSGSSESSYCNNGKVPVNTCYAATSNKSIVEGHGNISGDPIEVSFVKLTDKAFSPQRFSENIPGYELFSAYSYMLPAEGKVFIKFDIKLKIPQGAYATIVGRPSQALVYSVVAAECIVSSVNRGNLGIVLFNHSKSNLLIARGERVGTLFIHRMPKIILTECANDEALA